MTGAGTAVSDKLIINTQFAEVEAANKFTPRAPVPTGTQPHMPSPFPLPSS